VLTLKFLGASQFEVEAPQTIWVGRAKSEVIDTEDAHARAQSKSATAPRRSSLESVASV
jgi:hypothetical protein